MLHSLPLPLHASLFFLSRYVTLTFAQGENTKEVSVAIINNKVPRTDVVFYLVILNTTGGADIGDQSLVNITVLSHDNAYGLIGFANVSYTERVTTENFRLSHS